MARKRMIDPEFWSDEKTGSLSFSARLLFIGMWNFSDDDGIIKARSEYLKSSIFPYDSITREEVANALDEIEKENLIFRYTNSGQTFAIILNFRKHQVINKPVPSKLPKPSLQNRKYQEAIFKRDNWNCHLCDENLEGRLTSEHGLDGVASIDHVIPVSQGGSDLPQNLKTACLRCNKKRGTRDIDDYRSTTVDLPSQEKRSKEKEREEKETVADAPLSSFEQKIQEKDQEYKDLVNELASKDYLSAPKIHQIIVEGFLPYWLEKGDGQKKARWQKQTAFDYKRRIRTWMSRFHEKDYQCKAKNVWHRKGESCYCEKPEIEPPRRPISPEAKALAAEMRV